MIRSALLAASVAAALRLPAPATAQQQPFWPGGYQQSFPGAVCKASCAGPPPTSVIGFNKPITLYGYTQVGAPGDVPGDVGCDSPLSQVLCQDIADFASDSLCAEGEVATSSCVPVVSEEVQGPLCGATCAGVTAYGGAWLWLRACVPVKMRRRRGERVLRTLAGRCWVQRSSFVPSLLVKGADSLESPCPSGTPRLQRSLAGRRGPRWH